MRLFNLTDVETPELVARGLVNQTLAVRACLIQPGEELETDDDPLTRRDAAHYVAVHALAVDQLPPSYVVAKERMARAARAAKGELATKSTK